MSKEVLFVIWFFLPAALANSSAVIAAKIPILKKFNYPLDLYKKLGGKRILGDHKTIRGLLVGVFVAILTVSLQQIYLTSNTIFNENIMSIYNNSSPIILGTLMGLGAIMGDAVKSFFKRRVGIKPGGPWFPFDQIDFILGSILFTSIYIILPVRLYFYYLLVGVLGHIITNISAYLLKIKEVPY